MGRGRILQQQVISCKSPDRRVRRPRRTAFQRISPDYSPWHTLSLMYSVAVKFALRFTNGAPMSYPRAPSLAALPQFTLSHPTENRSIIFLEMKKWRMADRYINSPFSIFNSQLFTSRTNQTDSRIHSCRSRHSAANYRSGCSGSAGSGHSGHCPRGRANRSA